ncbi:hypothetical protein E4U56_007168, partial [Claviceps arundinis]
MSSLPLGGSANMMYCTGDASQAQIHHPHDRDDIACFEVGGLYRILRRTPWTPNKPDYLVLYDPDGRNRGFITSRRAKPGIFETLAQATYVYCRVRRRASRWHSLDRGNNSSLECLRGTVDWWTTEEEEKAWISTASGSEEEDWISTASGSEEEDYSEFTGYSDHWLG